MQQSEAEYKACLRVNTENIVSCQAQKEIWRADVQQYNNLTNGLRNGSVVTVQHDDGN